MPNLGKGTKCFKMLLSQTSSDMYAPLLPMLPPVLGTKISQAEFQYPSGQWLEMCGQQAALIADSAGNKGQLGLLAPLPPAATSPSSLVRHQLPQGCKDYSDNYVQLRNSS